MTIHAYGPSKAEKINRNEFGCLVVTTFLNLKHVLVCLASWQALQTLSFSKFILENPLTNSFFDSFKI